MGTDKKILVVNDKGTIEIDTVSSHSNGTKHVLHHALTAMLVVTAVVLFAATFHVIRQRVTTDEDFKAQQISLNENYVIHQHSSAPNSESSTIDSIHHRNDEEKDIGEKPEVDAKSSASNFMQATTDVTGTFSQVSVGNRRLVASRKVRDVDDHDEELDDSYGVQRNSSRFVVNHGFRLNDRVRFYRFSRISKTVLQAQGKPVLRPRRSPQIERRPEEWTLDLDDEDVYAQTRGTGGMRMRDRFGRRRA